MHIVQGRQSQDAGETERTKEEKTGLKEPSRRGSSVLSKLVFWSKTLKMNTNFSLKRRIGSHWNLVWTLDRLQCGFKIEELVGKTENWRRNTPILKMPMKPR